MGESREVRRHKFVNETQFQFRYNGNVYKSVLDHTTQTTRYFISKDNNTPIVKWWREITERDYENAKGNKKLFTGECCEQRSTPWELPFEDKKLQSQIDKALEGLPFLEED